MEAAVWVPAIAVEACGQQSDKEFCLPAPEIGLPRIQEGTYCQGDEEDSLRVGMVSGPGYSGLLPRRSLGVARIVLSVINLMRYRRYAGTSWSGRIIRLTSD